MKFRLKNGKKPISWQLPLANVLLPKIDPATGKEGPEKLIHYVPGASSIYVEDYKGDKKGQDIWFEDGEIEVRDSDVLKIEILKRHRWFNVHYELVDDNASAQRELDQFDLQEKALQLVNESDVLKLQAIALVHLGERAFGWTELMCKAELKKKAFSDPKAIIEEFGKPSYQSRYIVCLAMLKKIIKTNLGNTAVVWADTEQVIVRLAAGENAIDVLSQFLSSNSEGAMVTLQRLSEKAEGTPAAVSAKFESQAVDNSAELAAKDKEIEELKKQLAAKNEPKQEAQVANVTTGPDNQGVSATEEVETIEENKNEGQTGDAAPTLEELQQKYLKLSGARMLPPNQKNDAAWLLNKINALEAQQ